MTSQACGSYDIAPSKQASKVQMTVTKSERMSNGAS